MSAGQASVGDASAGDAADGVVFGDTMSLILLDLFVEAFFAGVPGRVTPVAVPVGVPLDGKIRVVVATCVRTVALFEAVEAYRGRVTAILGGMVVFLTPGTP